MTYSFEIITFMDMLPVLLGFVVALAATTVAVIKGY